MRSPRYDAVIVGAGHNGLVTAGLLARAGLRVLVVERRERPGGLADNVEVAPGFRAPVAHTAGRLRARPRLWRDLRLAQQGLRLIRPEVRAFAPSPDGPAITLWSDPRRTSQELEGSAKRDAAAFPRFGRKVAALASFVAYLHAATPPDLTGPSLGDALAGLRIGRMLRKLGRAPNRREVLRVLPMAVADFAAEHLEDDHLRAVVAARGVQYTAMGPWSAGTVAVLLADSVGQGGIGERPDVVEGGPGRLAEALVSAARSFGGEVRCGVEVARVTTAGDAVTGVALAGGEEVPAAAVISGADPKRTFLELVDPTAAGPMTLWRAENLRTGGTVAKVHLALDGLPSFEGQDPARLHGRIVLAGGIDELERAFDASKYGAISEVPYLEATIPSLLDPSLAPEGGHVMSVLVQYAPYRLREGHWDDRRDELGDLVLKRLEDAAPGLSGMVRERQVLTPVDLERDYGMSEGHPLHLEPGLDQFFAWRPMLGMGRYRTPIRGLYLCGSGSHPGGGLTGAPGANAAREILADLRS
jgi:phytoene dehydrogenase-like protein